MSTDQKSTRGAIIAAEIAVAKGDPFVAEEALEKALRQVREEQQDEVDA
ncbi:hypothetical protein [Natronorubrum halophilum]|nr:hypothetical protein [Natronorubrum halophilum]